MKAKTIFLAVVAIAALVWACSYRTDGLAWFPGFMIAITAALGVYDSVRKDKEEVSHE